MTKSETPKWCKKYKDVYFTECQHPRSADTEGLPWWEGREFCKACKRCGHPRLPEEHRKGRKNNGR